MLNTFIQYLIHLVSGWGYPGIVILMAMESSVLPVPSEFVMPPAGYLVSQGEMNPYIVVACATVGSVVGALANYFVAAVFGRTFLHRFGKYVLITPRRLDLIDGFFIKHGEMTTFTGRMLPVVRHLISFPAGLAGMKLPRFMFFTALGSGIWAYVLMMVGFVIGNNIDSVRSHMHMITLVTVAVLCVMVGLYTYIRRYYEGKRQ